MTRITELQLCSHAFGQYEQRRAQQVCAPLRVRWRACTGPSVYNKCDERLPGWQHQECCMYPAATRCRDP